MKKLGKALGAVAVAGAIAAGGSAFTASNSLPAASVDRGFGSQTFTGVTASSVAFVLDTPKENITGVNLVLDGDTRATTIQIGFSNDAPTTCSDAGTYDAGDDETTYGCSGLSQAVTSSARFNLIAE